MIVAGIGCRRGCTAAEIVALVLRAQQQAGCTVQSLAAPDFKQDEPGLIQAARQLGLEVHFVAGPALQAVQDRCPTRSLAASRHVGLASVAEGAALAASGGVLLLPRIGAGGATCAVAGA